MAWAISSVALIVALWPLSATLGTIGLLFLALAGVGQTMGALFDINHALHGPAAMIGIPSMCVAAVLLTRAVARCPGIEAPPRWSAHLPWISFALMLGALALFFSALQAAGVDMSAQAGPLSELPPGVSGYVGWANRLLFVATYVWAAFASRAVLRATHAVSRRRRAEPGENSAPGRYSPPLTTRGSRRDSPDRACPRPSNIGKVHAFRISGRTRWLMMRRSPVPPSPAFEAIARDVPFRDRIAVVVKAPPEAIFQALHDVTLRDMKCAWLLGELRYLPSRLAGRLPAADAKRSFMETVFESGTLVLRDDAPRELITGSAAQLHGVHQAPQRFANREAFEAFGDPGYEKLFMSVRVAPTGRPGEHWLVLEHATRALSPLAERKFARYWRVIKPMGAFVTWQLLRAVRRRAERAAVGPLRSRRLKRSVRATAEERVRALPGDERIPRAIDTLTHGVTIRRAPCDVWPWLVQMGAGSRGGWYSYDWLDNGRHPSARRIVPALQQPAVGAIFPALPGMTEGFTLLAIEPERTLTLGWLAPDGTLEVTWTFVLEEVASGVTRLLVRVRGGPGYRFHGLPLPLTRLVVRVVHFIMQRKQLLGIASRVERRSSARPTDAVIPPHGTQDAPPERRAS